MKQINRWIIAVGMVITFAAYGYASSDQELFLEANELYKKQQYAEADAVYQKIKKPNAQTWLNRGLCNFRLNRLGKSLVCWRRAEFLWGVFNRGELLNNINLVKKKLDEQAKALQPKNKKTAIVSSYYQQLNTAACSFIRAIPLLFFQLVFFLTWAFLLFFTRALLRNKKRWVLFCVVIFFIVFSTASVIKYGLTFKPFGVVVTEKADVLSGPGFSYQHMSTVMEGQEGSIKRESGEFYKVQFSDRVGWVSQSNFEKV